MTDWFDEKMASGYRAPTDAIMAGRTRSHGALAPALWASTAFEATDLAHSRDMSLALRSERFYSRYQNPTVAEFEEAIAALEGAEAALAFGSGMGAVTALILALCSNGDHVVATKQIYSGTKIFLDTACPRFGISVTYVDGTTPGAMAAAVLPGRTMMVIAETPANPQMSLVDLDELGAIKGPITVVDSTFATPILQQPIRHGVAISLHSATKGIAGHNDATLGVISGERELLDEVWKYATLHGAVPSPYDALNALRGVRTLAVRIERQSATAHALAVWLASQPEVEMVNYPGLESHPQYDLARRQMRDSGSMLSFDLRGGLDAGRQFCESTQIARIASTLGGPETLIVNPANSTHVGVPREERIAAGITDGLIRVSFGLEHPSDLIADFEQALAATHPGAWV